MSAPRPLRVFILHNDYGAFSGEEHMVDQIESALLGVGHAVRKYRVSGVAERSLGAKLRAAWWSLAGDRGEIRRVSRDIDDFAPDVILVQNLYPRLGRPMIRHLKSLRAPVVMRLANYRLFCPVGTASRDAQFCADCESRGAWSAVRHACAGTRSKSLVYAARHVLSRSAVRTMDHYIAQTAAQRRIVTAVANPAAPISVVPNPVAPHRVESRDGRWRDGRLRIAFVGRRSAMKGFDTVLELASRFPQHRFHVLGHPQAQYEAEIASLGNVVDHGFVSQHEVVRVLSDCHVLVVPSRWSEGMPNVILLARLAGAVCIVPAIGGLPEIAGIGMYGIVVSDAGPDAFAAAIEFIDARRTMGRAVAERACRRAATAHTPEHYGQRLADVFSEAVSMRDRNERETA